MIGGMLDFLVHNLRLGADRALLGQLLRPAAEAGRPPRVLAPGGHLGRRLRAAGFEVLEADGPEPLDAVCAPLRQAELGPLLLELSGWADKVRPGGLVLLVSRRGRPRRQTLCAAFLHAGLADPVQRTAGVAVVTAGRVLRRPPLHS